MTDIKDKVLEMLITPMTKTFAEEGLTPKYLAKKLKGELNYREPIEQVITEGTGRNKKTRKIMKGLKTPAAMQIRQKARSEAHKLLGHFPPDKKEFAGPGGLPLGSEIESRPVRIIFVDPDKESKEKE